MLNAHRVGETHRDTQFVWTGEWVFYLYMDRGRGATCLVEFKLSHSKVVCLEVYVNVCIYCSQLFYLVVCFVLVWLETRGCNVMV